MKKMSLEEVKNFLKDKIEGVKITSFPELTTALEAIPGINFPYVHVTDDVPLTREEEQLKNNVSVLSAIFDEKPGNSISLHVQDSWLNGFADYEVGFRLGDKFVAIASGLYSPIVKAVA